MVSNNRQGVLPFGAWLHNYTNSCKIATTQVPRRVEGGRVRKKTVSEMKHFSGLQDLMDVGVV